MLRLFKVLLMTAGGVLFAAILSRQLSDSLPHDMARTRVLMDSIPQQDYNIAFFGNSVLMNAVNTSRFSMPARNFGSSAQSLEEGIILFSLLPDQVEQVVHFVDAKALMEPDYAALSPDVLHRYLLEGYEPDDFTALFVPDDLNVTNTERIRYERNKLQGAISYALRLQKPIADYRDVRNPFQYDENLPEDEVARLVKLYGPQQKREHFYIHDDVRLSLTAVQKYLNAKHIRYTVVIAPIHPDMNYADSFYRELETVAVKERAFDLLNLSRLLQRDEFIDHAHPNEQGREKITETLTQII